MQSNKALNRAKENKNNEFYTTFEHMQYLFQNEQLKVVLKDKVVYLPCDTDESKIYLYLKQHQLEYGIKEILHTSDDYYAHLDLYNKADIVFTNPPFTGLRRYVKFLQDQLNKDFVLFSSWATFYYWDRFWEEMCVLKRWKLLTDIQFEYIPYDTPDNNKIGVQAFVFTNIDGMNNTRRRKLRDIYTKNKNLSTLLKTKSQCVYFRDDNVLFVKSALYLPNNYDGEMTIQPFTYYTLQPYLDFIRKDDEYNGYRYIVKLKNPNK